MKNKKRNILIISIIAISVVSIVLISILFKNKSIAADNSKLLDKDGKKSISTPESVPKEQGEIKLYKNIKVTMPIFMYHFILDDYGKNKDRENFVKPSTLEEQLKYITENGYQTVFVSQIEDLSKYTKPIALTFDDCFVYFYNNAFPLLKKYNQKATIYIICDYVNGENYLTTDQIKEMSESGLISVQSHTLTHRELTKLSVAEYTKELVDSKKYLEDTYKVSVDTICYPVGKCNDNIIKIAKENYKYGLIMSGGVYNSSKNDLYKIPRIYAKRSMSLKEFSSYLSKSKVELEY